MGFTLVGLLLLSVAPTFGVILIAVALVGIGSSVFHPESSRVARLASGGRHGFAQSLFQVGGNAGSATGPLLAALHRAAERAAEHRLVRRHGARRDGDPGPRRQLVSSAHRRRGARRRARTSARRFPARASGGRC